MGKKKKNREEIIENAVAGGLIGAALGALLTGKSNNSLSAALLGAAIGASIKALEEARDQKLEVLIEENGSLYYLYPDGTKKFVKRIGRSSKRIPRSFTLE